MVPLICILVYNLVAMASAVGSDTKSLDLASSFSTSATVENRFSVVVLSPVSTAKPKPDTLRNLGKANAFRPNWPRSISSFDGEI